MSEPLDAYATAYDALAGTPAEDDREFRATVARQIVDTLMHVRSRKGLGWLRGVEATDRYNQLRDVSALFGPQATDSFVGRTAMHKAYIETAAVIVTAYARPRKEG